MTNDFAPWNAKPGAPLFKNSVNHETDWLDSVQTRTVQASSIAKAASDEADAWISTKTAAVLADQDELKVQASGYADLWAGGYGVQAPMAKSAFLKRLVRLGAFEGEEYDDYFEEDRSARVRYEKTEGGDVDTTKSASRRTAASCSCATNQDGSVTTMLCPQHADNDPCQTMADVTGGRRRGSIINGVCSACGWSDNRTASRTAATGNPFNAHYSDDPAPWKAQFAGVAEGVWSGNGLTFETVEDATAYAQDLLMRWTGADMARVVPTETPPKEPVDPSDPSIVISYRTASLANLQTVPDEEIDREHMPAQAADLIPTTQAFNAGEFTVEGAGTMPGFYRQTGPDNSQLEWVPDAPKSDMQSEKERLFPDGIPLHGDLTPEQEAWMKRRGSIKTARQVTCNSCGTTFSTDNKFKIECPSCGSNDLVNGTQRSQFRNNRYEGARHTGAAKLKYDDTGSHWAGLYQGDDYVPLPWLIVSNDGTVLGAWPTEEAAQEVLDSGQMRFVDYDAATRTFASKNAVANPTLEMRPIYEIAADIKKEWGSSVNFAAVPYLDAMMYISSASDTFYADSGTTIVSYFLTNSSSFRGDRAKELKAELKRHLGRTSSKTANGYEEAVARAKEKAAQYPDLVSAAEAAYDRQDDAWFDALTVEDLEILMPIAAAIGSYDDEVFDALARKGYDFGVTASRRNAGLVDDRNQDGSATSTLPDVDVASAPENFPQGWLDDDDAYGYYEDDAEDAGDDSPYLASRRTASSCADCGASIEQDPEGESNRGWHHNDGSTHDHEAKPAKESRRTASIRVNGVSLTNVGLDGDVGVGTDPQGNRVRFRLTPSDVAQLKQVLYSDLAVNFSGVDVDEEDIISEGSRRTAGMDMDQATVDAWTSLAPGTPIRVGFEEDARNGTFLMLFQNQNPDFYGNAPVVLYEDESGREMTFIPARTETPRPARTASRRTAASPGWLQERVNDPYGTPNKVYDEASGEYVDNPFWVENPYEDINDFRVIERDGKGYVMHRRQNYWMNFNSRDEAVAHARGADGSLDMWASRHTALPGDDGMSPDGARPQTPLEGHDDSAMFEPDEILGQWDEENTATNANTTTASRKSAAGPEFDLFG